MDNDSRIRVQSPFPSINVTPLIDVLLVLLIIFMVISPRHEQKLPVMAPAPSPDGPPSTETLMLTMSGELRLELNSKAITAEELRSVLIALMEQRTLEQRTLFIKAPAQIPYDPVVALIDCAKGAGVVTVGLIQGEVKD
jgi:biopolymer transport protein ExbD